MIEVICYDKIKKQKFTLNYRDLEKLRKFYNKCKYSKRIKIIAMGGFENNSQQDYVMGY